MDGYISKESKYEEQKTLQTPRKNTPGMVSKYIEKTKRLDKEEW